MWVKSLAWEDPLEAGMATHSRILPWRIPWTEEPGGLYSIGSQRVRHSWNDLVHEHTLYFSSVKLFSHVRLFTTPWTASRQASLFITNSQCLLTQLMSIKSVMPSNHLILCRSLLLPPSIFPSIRVFSNESVLHIR